MNTLRSFDEYTKIKNEKAAAELESKNNQVREESARSFRDLLSEYGVTKVSELEEEKRTEFFSRLEGTDLNESLSLVEEGTRSFFGKIDRKGDIEAVYMHYDGYPENMLPLIKKGYSGSKKKNIYTVLKNGAGSGLDSDPNSINYYNDGEDPLTGNAGAIRTFIGDAKQSWAEFIYLYDERDNKWYMADTYEDDNLRPAFESYSVNEAVIVTGKRDAKKVATQYNHIFNKRYPAILDLKKYDGGDALRGAIKVIFNAAMVDANFHREAAACSRRIKGSLGSIVVPVESLGGIEVNISSRKLTDELEYNESSRISNAASWSGLAIVEGTSLYLDQIGDTKIAQELINTFNTLFDSLQILESRVKEGNEFGAARAKAIAKGDKTFKVGDEEYPVKNVDKEDKENAKEFAGESVTNEAKKYKASDIIDAWDSAYGEDILQSDHMDVIDDIENDYKGRVTVKDLEEIFDDRYGEELDRDFLFALGESVTNETRFYAFHNGKKHEFEAESLWKAKQKAITDLKVRKKDVGMLAIVPADQHDEFSKGNNSEFAFESTETVNEGEIKSDEEFKEYAFTVLQKAFGEDFDEGKAQEVVDGILSKTDGDYGAAVGMLTSSLG